MALLRTVSLNLKYQLTDLRSAFALVSGLLPFRGLNHGSEAVTHTLIHSGWMGANQVFQITSNVSEISLQSVTVNRFVHIGWN